MSRRKTFGLVLIDTPSYTTLGIRYYEAWKRLSSRGAETGATVELRMK